AHKVLEDVAQNPEGALIQGVWKAFGQKRFIKSVAHYNRNGEVNSRLMNVKLSTDRIKKTMMNSLVNYGLDMTGNRISLEEEKAIIAEAERVYGLIGKRIYPGGIDVLWQNIGRHLALVGIDIANEDILKLKQGTFKGRSFNNQGITALLKLLRYRLNTILDNNRRLRVCIIPKYEETKDEFNQDLEANIKAVVDILSRAGKRELRSSFLDPERKMRQSYVYPNHMTEEFARLLRDPEHLADYRMTAGMRYNPLLTDISNFQAAAQSKAKGFNPDFEYEMYVYQGDWTNKKTFEE